MRYCKLKEICNINGGYAFKSLEYTSEGTPLVRIGNINNGTVETDKCICIEESNVKDFQAYVINKGDILVALSGATTGKFGIYNNEKIALLNQRVAKIAHNDKVYNRYLYHYMNILKDKIFKGAMGAAQPNISTKAIEEMKIYIPDMRTQIKIAIILDKAQDLINIRKEQINACNELEKSLFYEMFGDPILNSKSWEYGIFESGIKEIKYGTSTPPEFSNVGIPFIRATNIKNGRIVPNDIKYISASEGLKINKCRLAEGDIIIVRSGANAGDSAFTTREYEGTYGGYDLIVRLNNRLHWNYIIALLNSVYRTISIDPLTRRAGQPHLNSQQIQNLEIQYPNTELQLLFAARAEKIEHQKQLFEKSLIELENNFNALMQKAFKGELF